jgi:plastocyanin
MRRTILSAAFTLAFVAVPTGATAGGGCYSDHPSQPEAATKVVIDHACFGPTVAALPLGGTLTWENKSGLDHNLTGPAVQFTELPDGATHSVTFAEAGIYVYACTIHPGMSGAVVVGAAAAPTAAPAAPVTPPVATTPIATTPVATESGGPTAPGWAVGAFAILGTGALVLRRRALA